MLQRIYLIRHGETDWNQEGRAQGQHDIPLNQRGREQARQICFFLEKIRPSSIMTSDLSRAFETAEIIGRPLGLQPIIHPELRERDMGKFSGMTHQEIGAYGITDLTRWDDLPGVETDAAILERVIPCLEMFLGKGEGEGVVVTHGGVIKVLISHFMGINHQMPRRFVLHNGLIAVFQMRNDALMLESLLYPELIGLISRINSIDN